MQADGMTPLGLKIALDRYAQNDPEGTANLQVGDSVVVILKTGREIGDVTSIDRTAGTVSVKIYPTEDVLENHPIDQLDRLVESSPSAIQKRVAEGIASVEATEHERKFFGERFSWLLEDWKFVPAGRILASAGTKLALTSYNCYVIPNIPDNRSGLFKSAETMTEIMSRGGGVGMNISSLRPKGAYVKGVNGRSSGAVSWAGLFSFTTGLIEQGGSRRGAAMIMLNDWHPEIFDFISAKQTKGVLENANISVAISDSFMKAVKADDNWVLQFPDTTEPDYDELWDGDLHKWILSGRRTLVYRVVKAREIWDAIISSAWASAEPGVFFIDRYNEMSNSNYYPEGKVICTNPCAEQGLPAWGVCNLGALNLPKFFDPTHGDVDWDRLDDAVRLAVRFLDNVIDWTPYFFEENKAQQLGERRVGLGIMGLAELLVLMEMKYGSDEAVEWTEALMGYIRDAAYETSAVLADEKGCFPKFHTDMLTSSGYAKTLPGHVKDMIKAYGLRNVTLLTVAPTGSTGTMVNTSTGIEPYFAWEWTRKGRLGTNTERAPIAQAWMEAHPEAIALPDYFVTAMTLEPIGHVKMQAAVQKLIDTSISKTVNLPNSYTIEQTSDIYMMMYDTGCKGGTIYRDGSRYEQVLYLKEAEAASETTVDEDVVPEGICPECRNELIPQEGCETCTCGYGLCAV